MAAIGRIVGRIEDKLRPKKGKLKTLDQVVSGRSETQVSQNLQDVLEQIAEDGTRIVVAFGDRAFHDRLSAAGRVEVSGWISSNFQDLQGGADRPSSESLARGDAVVVGGGDVPTNFRFAVRALKQAGIDKPVYWVHERFEFCGGTLAIPLEIEDADNLVFNHFEQYFAIRDPLLFRIEFLTDQARVRRYRILSPNESLIVRLSDWVPERTGPVTL